ncbi:hypothetical protein BKA64DRAFT_663845 [Cadophora sp. MPI-SDFR-AT-0126]|nr:hypothetical protein BKA64DRAFT_663845 [Leotiomycetes sp. MPI-SDFR-AT-0126]
MDVPSSTWPTRTNQSGDAFACTNPPQYLSLQALPLPSSQCHLLGTDIKPCSVMNYSSPTMPATDGCTIVLLVPSLDQSRRQDCPICQLKCQHIRSNYEYLSHDLSKPQTVHGTWVSEATSEATLQNDFLSLADSNFLPPSFSIPIVFEPQSQSIATSLPTHYLPQNSPSPEEPHELQPNPHQQGRRHACSQPNCSASFKRVYDLKRHIATIHGRKDHCPYASCDYETGRKDKMVEHAKRIHGAA